MNIITMDAETFFDDEYSLRKMTTEAYCRDERFECLGWGVREPNGTKVWVAGADIRGYFTHLDETFGWNNVAILAHHANFDGLILAHHFGVKPRVWLDTLSMARLVVGNHLSVSLDSLARHFDLAAKSVPYNLFKGKHWAELDHSTQSLVASGCLHDVELTWDIFGRLAKGFPAEEYPVIDMTVRMFTEPTFLGDVEKLGEVWTYEERRKKEMLTQLGVDPKDLLSSDKFAELLRAAGCEPETKPSPSDPERRNYCFAKTDQFMKDLLEDDDDRIRGLAEARLGVKSTIDQTRAERIGYMAQRGALPIYLNYAGAHTSRWSGGDSLNWQNLKRGGGLRKSVLAPPGHKIVKADKSQVECRFLNLVAGQMDVVERFREGKDPYIGIASAAYGEGVYKPAKGDPRQHEMETKRGTGKQLELSCLGPDTLVLTDNGPKPITTVQLSDRVWDGVEWVKHQGILERGVRTAIAVAGLWVTPDHLVWCGTNFLPAHFLQNENMLCRALAAATGKSRSQAIRSASVAAFSQSSLSALAAQTSTLLTPTTWHAGLVHAATPAPRKQQVIGLRNITGTQTSALTTRIVDGCSAASARFSHERSNQNIKIMLGGGLAFSHLGRKGRPGVANSWHTFLHSLGGITPRLIWIAVKTIKGMLRGIFNLLRIGRTARIGVPLRSLKKKTPVYDLAYCGPRNRFTVLSERGPLIVHNCGYGAGADTIVHTAAKGTYGPPVKIDLATGLAWRDLYRGTHPFVVELWNFSDWCIGQMAAGRTVDYKGVIRIEGTTVYLPNGIPLHYPELQWDHSLPQNNGRSGGYKYKTRKGWKTKGVWGGFIVENFIQALSRVDMSQTLLRVLAYGYRPAILEHDAAAWIIKDEDVDKVSKIVKDEMTRAPTWLPNIPLDCEVSIGERYS